MKNYRLSNGVVIPEIGLGTWCIENGSVCKVINTAVRLGYAHIDTAQCYENESGVGEGIGSCGLQREKIFLTTKVRAEIKNYKDAKKSIDESLKKLDTEYVDLLLIHCPQPWNEFLSDKKYYRENAEVWRALEEAYKEGKTRSIGVSNFFKDDLQNIFDNCEIKPMVNQFVGQPKHAFFDLIDFCKSNGVVCESYSPIGHGDLLRDAEIVALADKYRVSTARFCIKYVLQLGTVALPKAVSVNHLKDNLDLNFEISEEDMNFLKSLNR